MQLEILNLKGKSYSLIINDLLKPVSPSQCSFKVYVSDQPYVCHVIQTNVYYYRLRIAWLLLV